MSSANRPLRVDQLARGLFDRASVAVSRSDGELAMQVCRELGEIEPAYRLALKTETHNSNATAEGRSQRWDRPSAATPKGFRGFPLEARRGGKCCVCSRGFSAGAAILWDREARSAAHAECGETSR